jgi:plastocyanin
MYMILRTVAAIITLTIAWSASVATAGTINGIVRFTGAAPEPKKMRVTVDHAVCGAIKDADDLVVSPDKGLHYAVVSLVTPPPDARWTPTPPVQMDQKQCVFIPRIVVVPVGGSVEFLNTDRLLHNIHSAAKDNPPFNRTQPKGRTIPIVFRKPEIVRIDCDLHPWMRAWVVVAEHPFHSLTNEQGAFTLTNVPPGKYTIQSWHETLGIVKKDVTVTDGVTTVTIDMPGR